MQFFTYAYWFEFPPFITQKLLILLVVIFGLLFVGGIVVQIFDAKIIDRWVRQVTRRFAYAAVWVGALGLILVFARYERVPIFMYRYWFLFLAAGAALWIFKIERYAENRREQLDEETRRYNSRDKYLKK